MKEELVDKAVVESFTHLGFDGDPESTTYGEMFKWLREKRDVHFNILAKRNAKTGVVEHYLKSTIIGNCEIGYKKRNFEKYEDCANFALVLLNGG